MFTLAAFFGIAGSLSISLLFHDKSGGIYLTSCLLAGATVVLLCVRSSAGAVQSTSWLGAIGKWLAPFSYTLYLIHYPIMLFLFFLLRVPPMTGVQLMLWVAFVVAVHLGALLIAYASARIVENRVRLKSWASSALSVSASSRND